MNSKQEIIARNRKYLEEYLNMTENEWLEFLKTVGRPTNEFGKDWNTDNPSSGWCGGVTKALIVGGKIPDGYVACKNKDDKGGHFYMINPKTNEAIDLTIYQFDGVDADKYDHSNYKKQFGSPIFSKNIKKMFYALGLDIDTTKFTITRKGNCDYYEKVK